MKNKLAALLVAASLTAGGQGLPLRQAITQGLEYSPQLRASQARVQQQQALLEQARNRQLPEVSVSGQYMQLNNPAVRPGFPVKDPAAMAQMSVRHVALAQASVGVPLFAGFKIRYGIASAKFLQKAAELDVARNRDEVIGNLLGAYFAAFKAQNGLTLVQQHLERARQRAADFSNLEKNGLLARNDLLRAELEVTNLEATELEAKENLQTARYTLNTLMGRPGETAFEIDSLGFRGLQPETSSDEWVQKALQNRPDLAALAQRQQAADMALKVARADYLPTVSLSAGYINADIHPMLTVTNALNAGLSLKYNIASLYKTKAHLAEAEARRQELRFTRQQSEDGIRVQTVRAFQAYQQVGQKLPVYRKAVEQATENYRIVKNKYDNALATATDLLDADVALLQARLNLVYGQADVLQNRYVLLQQAGILQPADF